MSKTLIYNRVKDIHSWLSYAPQEAQYARYKTNIIFAGIKISDLYASLCTARSNLYYYELDDYGEISSKDAISTLYTKSGFIENALMYYNISVDLFWQVLWVYYNNFIADKLATEVLYQESIKDCNYPELLLGLTLCRDIKMREIVKGFFNKDSSYLAIRPLYNYLKHRGTYYIDGLGLNDQKAMFNLKLNAKFYKDHELPVLDALEIPLVPRRELDLDNTAQLLEEFDKSFISYCEYVFSVLMAYDYLDKSCPMTKMLQYPLDHLDEIIEYNLSKKGLPEKPQGI